MADAIERRGGVWLGSFEAMAGPCEVLLDLEGEAEARALVALAAEEARRIERKFSRYRTDNVIQEINTSAGRPVAVDAETAGLLDFSARCHQVSGGRFDVTSGVLRRVWRFDGSDRVPTRRQAKELLPLVGWDKVRWENPHLTLPAGMEIDLGGVGKEYAVDRVCALLSARTGAAILVNFGGDLRAQGPRRDGLAWEVGVDTPDRPGVAARRISLRTGALATSGDSHRFLLRDGVRYPHILDPRTGWPVMRAPRAVTVLGDTCLEAGLLSSLAMLHGRGAETFLENQGVKFWVARG
ncbi:MAG: FAD:protein FMN transferase [Candidatus Krumholzibacteriia bacterium]